METGKVEKLNDKLKDIVRIAQAFYDEEMLNKEFLSVLANLFIEENEKDLLAIEKISREELQRKIEEKIEHRIIKQNTKQEDSSHDEEEL